MSLLTCATYAEHQHQQQKHIIDELLNEELQQSDDDIQLISCSYPAEQTIKVSEQLPGLDEQTIKVSEQLSSFTEQTIKVSETLKISGFETSTKYARKE